MDTRSATMADLPAITDLQRLWDVAHFGTPEHDESEVREDLEHVESLDDHSRLVFDEGRLVAAAWWWSAEAVLIIVHPDVDAAPIYDDLLIWLEQQRVPTVAVLSNDEELRAALAARGWHHTRSGFELIRDTGPDWVISMPHWPDGIVVQNFRAQDAAVVHRLIYLDAGWDEVPGHHAREFSEWQAIFLTDAGRPDQQVLAWRHERLVGVALGRMYSGDVGWIAQLAVAKDERGVGLGRALLLEALRRRAAAGATSLGLAVQAENRGALQLYFGVGLAIDREWQDFEPPSEPA